MIYSSFIITQHHKLIFITSHAEEVYIQKAAEQAGVWLIPKALIGEISLIL